MDRRKFSVSLILLTGCASTGAVPLGPTPETVEPTDGTEPAPLGDPNIDGAVSQNSSANRETITVPMSLYVVLDAADPQGSVLSSRRTEADLQVIAGNMREVWSQADVDFDPINIQTIEATTAAIEPITIGLDTGPFFNGAGSDFDVPSPSAINGFYVRTAGRVNGFAPTGSGVFFVVDEPSVNDERVSSHEVGHLFALHHDLQDAGTLMFSGTNGTVLSEEEQLVARYAAQGILDGAR